MLGLKASCRSYCSSLSFALLMVMAHACAYTIIPSGHVYERIPDALSATSAVQDFEAAFGHFSECTEEESIFRI